MTPTAELASANELRRPKLDRATAMRLAATEYARFADAVDTVEPAQWHNATDCPQWDVHALVSHVLGMTEMAASIREEARQRKAAIKRGGLYIDALTDLQVRKHAGDEPAALAARVRRMGPKAARGRRRTPWFIRRRAMPIPGMFVDGKPEWWTLGYLIDVILTRDPWMHRIDLSRAIDRPMQLSADHDGILVADVVDEWAERHGQPYQLHLTGPAGGTWSRAGTSTPLELDAIEFCRTVSRREQVTGLLATEVPF